MEFQIDRKTWLHGEGSKASYLLRKEDGKKCCLGFFCNALGISDDIILNKKSPDGVGTAKIHPFFNNKYDTFKSLILNNVDTFKSLILNNDEEDETDFVDESREHRITRLFDEMGVKVEFIN